MTMGLLLDTHVFLWWLQESARLSPAARAAIASGANQAWVSAASIWEIAIKSSIGKLKVRDADVQELSTLISAAGFSELPVRAAHAAGVRDLPFHHADPFDRMLVAQARAEGFTIVTADGRFASYGVPLLNAKGS